ncbi:hypothetical protein Q9L58_004988 [Maublancomyces gigas]|uniref:Acyl-protein thioesterase 1 n=1 Tax=Discina gigas TaxID=1032678 RepID=A0ABR3GJG7_9PEZI
MTTAAAVVVLPAIRQTATFIFLHGLGDNGTGWSSVAENFRLRRKFDDCTFIFPHAPRIPITINMGTTAPGWFDITSISGIYTEEDEPGMLVSVRKIHGIINEQIDKGISSERIILGGFSQGGAIALLAGLTCEHKLGGIVGLSTWLPLRPRVARTRTEINKATPIFLAHGENDPTVKYAWGEASKQVLSGELGYEVEWRTYPNLGHSADPQEIADMEKWLHKILPVQV